jgi:hypothetical protein
MSQLIKDNLDIKAPQAIVHIKHRISLRQYKYWIVLLQFYREQFEAKIEPNEDGFFRMPKAVLTDFLGYDPVKEELKTDFESLRREPIIINYLEKDGTPAVHGMGFLSEWKITSKTIAFRLPSFLQDVMKGLDQPKAIFQLLNWQIFNHFTGKYEAIIYKLCRDYRGVGRTPYITLAEFREYMGLKTTEYAEFMKLNEWVIKRPCKSINESPVSDIEVTPEFERNGRKVIGLRFIVKTKQQTNIPFPELESNEAFKFAKVHIEVSTQLEYLALRTPEEIELCIERANEYGEDQTQKGKAAMNYGGLYRKAITEGWHIGQAEKRAKKSEIQKKKQEAKKAEAEAKNREQEEQEAAKAKIEVALLEFDTQPEAFKQSMRTAYAETLSDVTRKYFDKDFERSPMHTLKFLKFVEINKSTNI